MATKTQRMKALREVLYRYPPGSTVANAEDVALLLSTVECHPERDEKIGVGVASFQVERNMGSLGFWLTRTDGSRTDWSFYSCLTPPSREALALRALRTEVRDQIAAFKEEAFAGGIARRCPVTGDIITKQDAHIDHAVPFRYLVNAWLSGRDLSALDTNATTDGNTDTLLVDRDLAALWRSFHKWHAELRAVSRRANLSVLTRKAR